MIVQDIRIPLYGLVLIIAVLICAIGILYRLNRTEGLTDRGRYEIIRIVVTLMMLCGCVAAGLVVIILVRCV